MLVLVVAGIRHFPASYPPSRMGTPAMKKFVLPAVALSVSIFALSLLAPSRAHAWASGRKGGAKTETYMVIKITDENKDESKNEKKIEFKAIAASQYTAEEKRIKDEFKKKMDEWRDLKKTDPTAPQPKRIVIKKIPNLTGYLIQKDAADAAKKLQDEAEGKTDTKKDTRK